MSLAIDMSSFGDNIDTLIENIKISEHYAESQRNELHAVETEISSIKSEMVAMSSEREELEKELKKLCAEVNKQDAFYISLGKEVTILRNVYKELKDEYDKESKVLSKKQQEVWSNRERFCNNLREFAEDWGPSSSIVTNKCKKVLSGEENNLDLQSEEMLFNELQNLKESIVKAEKKLSEAEENLTKAKSLKEKLSEEPEWGEEFVSLQTHLRRTQLEVEVLEKQCEQTKQAQWRKPKDSRQLMFFPEPSSSHLPTTKTASHHGVHEKSFHDGIQSFPERSLLTIMDKNSSWNDSVNDSNTFKKFAVKRPVAAVAPAIDLSQQEMEPCGQNEASTPKKICSFIPKKPSSLSKKFFTHSNSWSQLEKELSDLLKKDLPRS